jgi:hypothetical protein
MTQISVPPNLGVTESVLGTLGGIQPLSLPLTIRREEPSMTCLSLLIDCSSREPSSLSGTISTCQLVANTSCLDKDRDPNLDSAFSTNPLEEEVCLALNAGTQIAQREFRPFSRGQHHVHHMTLARRFGYPPPGSTRARLRYSR